MSHLLTTFPIRRRHISYRTSNYLFVLSLARVKIYFNRLWLTGNFCNPSLFLPKYMRHFVVKKAQTFHHNVIPTNPINLEFCRHKGYPTSLLFIKFGRGQALLLSPILVMYKYPLHKPGSHKQQEHCTMG